MKIVTLTEMKRLEAEAEKLGITSAQLMENAGRRVAENTRRILRGVAGRHILVLVGPGNNGGDGLVAARYLRLWGGEVTLCLCTGRQPDDNLKSALEVGARNIPADTDNNQSILSSLLASADAVIDAIFGTGQDGAIEGACQGVLFRLTEAKNTRPALKIISVDLPSGLNADNGKSDPATPFADYTITLGLPKRGLYSPAGAERAGEVIIADIGLPAGLTEGLKSESITSEMARATLPRRLPNSHKGSYGKVMMVAGSLNYVGAANWACGAAMRVGAGLVTLAIPKGIQAFIAPTLPEATYLPLTEASGGIVSPDAYKRVLSGMQDYNVILLGPGLGQSAKTREFALKTIFGLGDAHKVMLDADALNYLAGIKEWWECIPFDAILTPHPGEMGRLCGLTAQEVQANRFELAQQKAAEWNKTIVLKGANTVVASPDGRMRINLSANAGLASAGTGDVLAGAIAGLLAQGLSLFDAASLGVYLHSQAGESVRAKIGDAGMVASDLLPELPLVIKQLKGTVNTKT